MNLSASSLISPYWNFANSLGAASELAGLDRYTFLEFCKREGILLHTQSSEELEKDLQRFGSAE